MQKSQGLSLLIRLITKESSAPRRLGISWYRIPEAPRARLKYLGSQSVVKAARPEPASSEPGAGFSRP